MSKSIVKGIGIGFLSCIGIGIGIAKTISQVLVLVLVLLRRQPKYWYWLALSKRLNFSGPVGAGFFDLKPVGNRRRLQALLIQ